MIPKLLVASGIVMMIGGIIGSGATVMEMREQRHLHDRLCGVKIRLAQPCDWQSASFTLHEPGYHTLFLWTGAAGRESPRPDAGAPAHPFYDGTIEVRMTTPSDSLLWNRRVGGRSLYLVPPADVAWTLLDSVELIAPAGTLCSLEGRVVRADTGFSGTSSELVLMPPQRLDIGSYIYRKSLHLLGFGALTVAGFFVLVLGGSLKRAAGGKTG